jgi:hypothetical protein
MLERDGWTTEDRLQNKIDQLLLVHRIPDAGLELILEVVETVIKHIGNDFAAAAEIRKAMAKRERDTKPNWAKGLTAMEIKHLMSTSGSGRLSLERLKKNLRMHHIDGRDCWECLVIARKLNLTDLMRRDQ